jgi:acetolactate synthase-1/3 small subunit
MVTTKHTLVAMVTDKPGVLNRAASLFRRRGFNIDSITVGHSELPHISRMTIVVIGTTAMVEQVRKQLEKLVDVIKVADVTGTGTIMRELALIKVNAPPATRSEIMQIVSIFRAKIIDVSADSLVIEATGDEDKLSSLYNMLRSFGIKELAKTGCLAMIRGASKSAAIDKESLKDIK